MAFETKIWGKTAYFVEESVFILGISSGVRLTESLNSSDCGRWVCFVLDPCGWTLILIFLLQTLKR